MGCNVEEVVAADYTSAQAEAGCGQEPRFCRPLHCDSKARGEPATSSLQAADDSATCVLKICEASQAQSAFELSAALLATEESDTAVLCICSWRATSWPRTRQLSAQSWRRARRCRACLRRQPHLWIWMVRQLSFCSPLRVPCAAMLTLPCHTESPISKRHYTQTPEEECLHHLQALWRLSLPPRGR